MIVGTAYIRLRVRHSRSLKDKRQVVRSIIERTRANHNVSVAEVDELDHLQLVVLGIAQVGFEVSAVQGSLQGIVEHLRRHPVAEFIDHQLEVGSESY